jgi:hypothetical protein
MSRFAESIVEEAVIALGVPLFDVASGGLSRSQ